MQGRNGKLRGLMALLAVALLAVLAGCGDDNGGGGGGGGSADNGAKKDVKVAVLATGAVNNRSWANSFARGAEKAKQDLGVDVTMVGNVETPDQYAQQGASFAAKGYDLIIFAHGAMNEPAVKLARQFPKVQWVQVPYEFADPKERQAQPENLGHTDFKQEQGSFLAGALAGMVTKSNKIGAVYAFPFPALTRQPEAFHLGARCTNSQIQFSQKATNSFTDAALARAAGSSLYSGGTDIIYSAVDQAVQGIIAAANGAGGGKYVIAQYFDQADLGPKVVLTSVTYNLDGVLVDVIKTFQDGKMTPRWYKEYAYKDGVGKLAPFGELDSVVSAEAKANLDKMTKAVEDGTIKVPDAVLRSPTIGKPGDGGKIDPASIGCTKEMQLK
jgi:basic membrane protein A and related proteins